MANKIYGNRWKVVRKLGEGGQGEAYLVQDTQDPKAPEQVLKRLKLSGRHNQMGRFQREIEAIRSLEHPNILNITHADLDTNEPYMITEYCARGTLEDRKEDFKGKVILSLIALQTLSHALSVAHQKGIVHRDVKPENVLFRDMLTEPVLADFGICFVDNSGDRFTLTREQVGPRYFMAPELEDGRAALVTPASDVYSLGKILYFMITGGQVFSREKHREPGYNLAETWPNNEPITYVNQLIDKMVTHDPKDRYASGEQVFAAVTNGIKLIETRCVPLDSTIQIQCRFCGRGIYKKMVDEDPFRDLQMVVRKPDGGDWRWLACTECGHVQLFRKDKTRSGEWPLQKKASDRP
jgi:serine/threonine protein kinase